MRLLTIAAADLPKLLPMPEAVEAMKSAFASLSAGVVVAAKGEAAGRRSDDEITLFKSGGHAVQDVVAASRAMRETHEMGLARVVEL